MNTRKMLEEKERTHGDFAQNSYVTMGILNICQDQPNWEKLSEPSQLAIHMICLKLSRVLSGDATQKDHFKDISGYATLALDALDVPESSNLGTRKKGE